MINDEDSGTREAEDCDTKTEPGSGEERFQCSTNAALSHLSKLKAKRIKRLLSHSEVFAYSLHDLKQASVKTNHHFELTDERPIYAKNRRMTPAHHKSVKEKLYNMLKACIISFASSTLSFQVVIATKNDGKLRFFVDFQVFNASMQADLWLLSMIEEICDDLGCSEYFSMLYLFTVYWQVLMCVLSREDDVPDEARIV